MFSNISSISFIGCSLKWLVNERDKRAVTWDIADDDVVIKVVPQMSQKSVGEKGKEEENGEDDVNYVEALDTLRRNVLFKPRLPNYEP